jgi:uncharacterized iron-regulated membrane protein
MNITGVRSLLWDYTRRTLKKVHLWLGLASSLVLVVVCLSGALYVFNNEVVELLNRDKVFVDIPSDGSVIAHEDLIAKVASDTEGSVVAVTVPANLNRAYIFMVRQEGERRGTNYYVNPYSGEIVSSAQMRGQSFFRTVLRLHRWLLLDRSIGSPIVGWATIIMSILIISGLVIWIPRNAKYWYKALKVKLMTKSKKRLNFDLHRGFGFYAAFIILIMTLTGPNWSFQWYRKGIYDVLGVEMPQRGARPGSQAQAASAQQTAGQGQQSGEQTQSRERRGGGQQQGRNGARNQESEIIADSVIVDYKSYSELIAAADQILDYKGNYRVTVPDKTSPSVSIMKSKTGFFAPAGNDRLELNSVTGELVSVDRFGDKRFNDQIASSIRALHTGEIFGMFTKILYFISALIATSLPVTGCIIWMNRIGKNQKERQLM